MILPADIPTRAQLERLLASRAPWSVSIYLPTSPSSRGDAERIELKNLAREASTQVEQAGAAKADIAALDDELADLVDDDELWRHQARSLALFLTPATSTTFRLANNLTAAVEVSDRFHLKPLLRALTFPHTASCSRRPRAAFACSRSHRSSSPPRSSSPICRRTSRARSASPRSETGPPAAGSRAFRPLLSGLDVPLILAATEPIDSIYRSVNTYPHLLATSLSSNPKPAPTPS